jgi:hypothetical protein
MRGLTTLLFLCSFSFPVHAQNAPAARSTFDRAIEVENGPSDPVERREQFLAAIEKIKSDLRECWKRPADSKGQLRYRLTVDRKGAVLRVVPYTENPKGDGIDRLATGAISNCRPYLIRRYYKDWDILELTLAETVEVTSLAAVPTAQGAQLVRAINREKQLPASQRFTSEDARALANQVKKCWNPHTFKHKFAVSVEMFFNADGSVGDKSNVTNGPDTNYDKALMDAIRKCQPYVLPAEKFEAWKHIILDFQM